MKMNKAVCVLTNNQPGISGYIEFNENIFGSIDITVNVSGLEPGLHGFHIHQTGDLRKGCSSLCSHFNPYGTEHGDILDNRNNRHVGDLGNIRVNNEGNAYYTFRDRFIKLKGKCNIVGRSVVIHEKVDDLGIGGLAKDESGNVYIEDKERYEESLKTGNAGKRIACGVIGWAE